MQLGTILDTIDVLDLHGKLNVEISNITYDSRKALPESLYTCLPGTKTDGHLYIKNAIENGAIAILGSHEWYRQNANALNGDATFIGVKDTREAFAKLCANFYNNPTKTLNLIGVTGTNGKTTTTHLIEQILRELGYKSGLIGTLYYRYNDISLKAPHTTPQALELQKIFYDMLEAGITHVVMEVSSHALEQKRVAEFDYKVGVLTNITQDHLDYHGTMDNYRAAKLILFEKLLSSDSTAVLNADEPSTQSFLPYINSKVLTYGIQEKADIYADNIKANSNGTVFDVHSIYGCQTINLPLIGLFNVYNALSALSSALAIGLPLEACCQILERAPKVKGRMEVITPIDFPFAAIVDYAHTPDGLINILKTAKQFTKNRLIIVFGCGGDRDKNKRPIMGQIASEYGDVVIVTSDNPRTEEPMAIIDDILTGQENKSNILIEEDRRKAIFLAINTAKEGDIVIIAGKGHETYQIFKDKTIHFDDKEVIESALTEIVQNGKF